jgi:hypothetical protein
VDYVLIDAEDFSDCAEFFPDEGKEPRELSEEEKNWYFAEKMRVLKETIVNYTEPSTDAREKHGVNYYDSMGNSQGVLSDTPLNVVTAEINKLLFDQGEGKTAESSIHALSSQQRGKNTTNTPNSVLVGYITDGKPDHHLAFKEEMVKLLNAGWRTNNTKVSFAVVLCTNDDDVAEYWDRLDKDQTMKTPGSDKPVGVDVLDDFLGEAEEVMKAMRMRQLAPAKSHYAHGKSALESVFTFGARKMHPGISPLWSYSYELHVARMAGCLGNEVADYLDEEDKLLTSQQKEVFSMELLGLRGEVVLKCWNLKEQRHFL